MRNIVRIIEIFPVTHDVKCFRVEKPSGYTFLPGHATDLSINKPGLEEESRPFTFTCLTSAAYLEFTIKRYPDHHGVTDRLHQLAVGDELIIRDSWGAIEYKKPGYFFAGGAGITPFIAILRYLYTSNQIEGNRLFFSNKTSADIIYKEELIKMMGANVSFILTRENKDKLLNSRIDKAFLLSHVTDFKKSFYVCGPDEMVHELTSTLQEVGASPDALVFEK